MGYINVASVVELLIVSIVCSKSGHLSLGLYPQITLRYSKHIVNIVSYHIITIKKKKSHSNSLKQHVQFYVYYITHVCKSTTKIKTLKMKKLNSTDGYSMIRPLVTEHFKYSSFF